MKKMLSIFISLALAVTPFTAAMAAETQESSLLSPKYLSGRIVDESENSIEVYSQISDESVILNLTEDTYVIDAVSGDPASLKERKGDDVAVYYGPWETRSLPPQSNAVAIICNIPQNYIPPHYTLVEDLKKGDGEIKVTANEGSIIIAIKSDTPVTHYISGNSMTTDEIEKGSEILLWYTMVAMSYPGQTTATKAVVLEKDNSVPSESGIDGIEGIDEIEGIDKEAFLSRMYTENDIPMIPLRLAAEAYGYLVEWDESAKSVTVSNEKETYILVIEKNQYGQAQLETGPEIKDSTTYVPLSFFEDVLNIDI